MNSCVLGWISDFLKPSEILLLEGVCQLWKAELLNIDCWIWKRQLQFHRMSAPTELPESYESWREYFACQLLFARGQGSLYSTDSSLVIAPSKYPQIHARGFANLFKDDAEPNLHANRKYIMALPEQTGDIQKYAIYDGHLFYCVDNIISVRNLNIDVPPIFLHGHYAFIDILMISKDWLITIDQNNFVLRWNISHLLADASRRYGKVITDSSANHIESADLFQYQLVTLSSNGEIIVRNYLTEEIDTTFKLPREYLGIFSSHVRIKAHNDLIIVSGIKNKGHLIFEKSMDTYFLKRILDPRTLPFYDDSYFGSSYYSNNFEISHNFFVTNGLYSEDLLVWKYDQSETGVGSIVGNTPIDERISMKKFGVEWNVSATLSNVKLDPDASILVAIAQKIPLGIETRLLIWDFRISRKHPRIIQKVLLGKKKIWLVYDEC